MKIKSKLSWIVEEHRLAKQRNIPFQDYLSHCLLILRGKEEKRQYVSKNNILIGARIISPRNNLLSSSYIGNLDDAS